MDAVVLVEGISDHEALTALAERRGLDLDGAGIAVVSMGGAHAIGRFLAELGPDGSDVRLAGLCDVGEAPVFRRGLERAGMGVDLDRVGMEALGFFVCELDLEDELIRALGADATIGVIERAGELDSFRVLQTQPAQRDRPIDRQLHRFLRSKSGRNTRYGRLLVEALDDSAMPRPLHAVLDHICARR
ncbi:MAG: ATP-dependent endonuclease [Actinobacteria bacterium]|nr:ATP-dependent endonuclease [Actinomycetota bacterium]